MSAVASVSQNRPAGDSHRRPGPFARLFEPVPVAPLVQFRVALGLILLWEAYRYLSAGWPRSLFLEPEVLFKYYGFEWVRPLPEPLHLGLFYALAALAVFVACGLLYRLAAGLLFFGWAYVFLLDQALYLNHLYLVTLISGLATLLPANRALSFDAFLRPKLRSATVPRWTLTLLRCQIGFVYFFGGVAKLNPDWLTGVPMQLMLLDRADLLGQPAGEPWVALVFAYGGLLLDLFIVPVLWWRRTRWLGLLLVAGFHLTNHVLFRIGIFPWFMMAATLILWPPYPLSMLSFARIYGSLVGVGMVLTLVAGREVPLWAWGAAVAAAGLLRFPPEELTQLDVDPAPPGIEPPADTIPPVVRPAVLALLGLYLGWQVFLPLRHFAYDLADGRYGDDASWTEQGHKWSWHMKLRTKVPTYAAFFVLDRDDRIVEMVNPFNPDGPLSFRQARTMTTRPELILQFAHHLRDKYAAQVDDGPVKVTAAIRVSLNSRSDQFLIDPEANLAAVEPRLWPPADWIMPLDAPRMELRRIDVHAVGLPSPRERGAEETFE